MVKFLLFITLFCCAGRPPMNEENVKQFEFIFIGEVVDVVEKKSKKILWFRYGNDGLEYHFKVIQAFKGVKKNQIIKVNSGLTSVDIHSSIGEEWLMVPSHHDDLGWRASICDSRRISENTAKKDIEFLNRVFR